MRDSDKKQKKCPHCSIFAIAVEDMLETAASIIELTAKEVREENGCERIINLLPSCFEKSYDTNFMDELHDRAISLLDEFQRDGTLSPTCVADELYLHMSVEIFPYTDTWNYLKKKIRREMEDEIIDYFTETVENPQIGFLYEKKTEAKAGADPEFIKKNGIKNLHIDRWFVPFAKN